MRLSQKTVILCLDGLDFAKTRQLLHDKRLPHFQSLNSFSSLKSSNPPQSPVAWGSFITGQPAQKHGLADFVARHPQNYQPYLPYSQTQKPNPFLVPPVWEKYPQIPLEILFLPDTFPAPKINGQLLSGMGTPDLRTTEGSFTLITDSPIKTKLQRGQIIRVKKAGTIKTRLPGPTYQSLGGLQASQIPLELTLEKNYLKIQGPQINFLLKTGQFSPWTRLYFPTGFLRKTNALVKFFLKSLNPLRLYISPLNQDPQKPLYKISHPVNFSKKLTQKYGPFATLGLPHDTWALEAGLFTERDFLNQADSLYEERTKIILEELKTFPKGLFIAYLGTADSIQHLFWKKQSVINAYYEKMDHFLASVQKIISPQTPLYLLSDHGFGPFDYEINLNNWLLENDYLTLKNPQNQTNFLENIDWSKTRAYALGFNSLYLNLKNREGQGIVTSKTAPRLKQEIKKKLKSLKIGSKPIIKNAYLAKTPDLIVGYYRGFRASWQTATGGLGKKVIQKRTGHWSGDHLFDVTEVPGVFFSNQKLAPQGIKDILPTVFKKLTNNLNSSAAL